MKTIKYLFFLIIFLALPYQLFSQDDLFGSTPLGNNRNSSQQSYTSISTNKSTSTKTSNSNYNATSSKSSTSRYSNLRPSSLTYKTWEAKFDKSRAEFVRSADGMVDETMYINCVCLSGICKLCAGKGVSGYGMFQTYCSYCGGTGRCHFCGGTGTKVTKRRYRYIDEYYSDGSIALHVTSSGSGPTVYQGGVGNWYYTYGNSQPIKDEGSYFSFGGETVYGVKTKSFRLSRDYRTLWTGNQEYHLIDKAEYDRLSAIMSRATGGYVAAPSGNNSSSYSSGISSSSSRSKSSSIYITCKSCGGGGGCTACNGKGYKFNSYSGHNDTCPVCNGSGRCGVCRGNGSF